MCAHLQTLAQIKRKVNARRLVYEPGNWYVGQMKLIHMRSTLGRRGHKWFPERVRRTPFDFGAVAAALAAIVGYRRGR